MFLFFGALELQIETNFNVFFYLIKKKKKLKMVIWWLRAIIQFCFFGTN